MKTQTKTIVALLVIASSLLVAKADSYTLNSINSSWVQTSASYSGYWKDSKFFITNGQKSPSKVIQFSKVQVEVDSCTKTIEMSCSKNESVVEKIKELLDRQSNMCLDASLVKSDLRDLVEQLYDMEDKESKICKPEIQTKQVATISDIIYIKWKTIYKNIIKYMLPNTGVSN